MQISGSVTSFILRMTATFPYVRLPLSGEPYLARHVVTHDASRFFALFTEVSPCTV
jgi:hypothetical protein